MANAAADECAAFCNSRREEAHDSTDNLKTAKWRLALDIPARIQFGSRRGNEAQIEKSEIGNQKSEISQSLLTSPATIETCLHAVERIPSAGQGQPAQFVPIRFIYRNKLTKDDKLLLAFDAFVLSEMLDRAVSLGRIIHDDDHATIKVKTGARTAESARTLATSHEFADKAVRAPIAPAQPRVTKVKTSALAGEVRKRLGKITALLASPAPPISS